MDIIPAGRVKVMTWNIWWRFGPNWLERQPALLQTMRAVDADVIALQEVWGNTKTTQADEFADQLGMHAGFAAPSYPPTSDVPRPEDDDLTLGLGLLSRWPIDTLRQAEMPARHRSFGPVTLVATLQHPAFDGALPIIVAGDLNAAPDSPLMRPLQEVLTDAWSAGSGDLAAVTLPSSHPAAPVEATELLDQRIDHIFYRLGEWAQRVKVESATVAGAPVSGVYPSDHRAVVCELSWRAGA